MNEPVQTKISKLAILSLVLGILSLLFFVLTGIPAIVIGIISTLRIKRSGGKLKGKYIALAGINFSVLYMYVFHLFWSIDAPPIPNDYTIADLRSAPTQYAESFEVLKTLIDEDHDSSGNPAIELTKSDRNMIADIRGVIKTAAATEISKTLNYYADEIKQIWADNEIARDVIHRLNQFSEIADLTELSIDFKLMQRQDLIELAYLYEVYAHLQTEQDDIHAVTVQLIELDSVFRKLSLNVRPFIGKLICLRCMEESIVTANAIVNNPQTTEESIELLAGHFTPLTEEQLSLRNGALFEYFLTKDAIQKVLGTGIAGRTLLLKRNSTLRLYKNCCDNWLEAMKQNGEITSERLSVWPNHYPFKDPEPLRSRGLLPLIYKCYNPIGSECIHRMGFFYNIDPKKRPDTIIYEDFFQIVLRKKLGKEVNLKAHAYSDEYTVDIENGKIFSPGPDGKVDTKDDIFLRINPKFPY